MRMLNRFKTAVALMRINLKTLILFEVIYRLLGFLIIFPLINLALRIAVHLSGYVYISNRVAIAFFTKPTTLLALLFIALLFSIFMIIELLFLSTLYHYSEQGIKINIKKFLDIGLRHTLTMLKMHHVKLIIPAFFFIAIVQLLHFAPLASTFDIPPIILDEMQNYRWLMMATYTSVLFVFVLFIETIFMVNIANIENTQGFRLYQENRQHLRKHRLKLIVEFSLLNIFLNAVLYGSYLAIIGLVALFIQITYGQALVLALLLTILYIIYALFALLATFILIPINFAWMNAWYYDNLGHQMSLKFPVPTDNAVKKQFKNAWVRLSIASIALLIFVLNAVNVVTFITQERLPLNFLNAPDIVAHRGASLDAPENTLAAIQQALDDEADGIEIDVQLTHDEVMVLFHDSATGRTTDDSVSRRIDELTYEALKELDAGSWFDAHFAGEKIPTLKEALLLIDNQADVYIDLKTTTPGIETMIIDLLYELDYDLTTVQILSFSTVALERFKAEEPNLKTVLLMPNFIGNFDQLIRLPYIDAYAFRKEILINNPSYVDRIHHMDKSVYVWTVNEEGELRDVGFLGLDAIITDDPILAREVAYSQYTRTLYRALLKELFSQ